MRRLLMTVFILAAGIPFTPASGEGEKKAPPPRAVPQVDLERYAGLWYQIALIPNRFQKQCVGGATAEYSLRTDGRIDVVNRCRKADGTVSEARGVAKVVDSRTHAKLQVSFVSFLGIRPFWGDYWILALDPGYRWALIGTPDRRYGWILARTPELGPEVLETIRGHIREQGYDPEAFVPSPP
jgi:apolipoprotein D and lipocalin family protein